MSDISRVRRIQRLINVEQMKPRRYNEQIYKLIGITNSTGFYPGFVEPIFVCEQDETNKYYIQKIDKHFSLTGFTEYNHTNFKIIQIFDGVNSNIFKLRLFTLNSIPVFCFQISDNEFFIGQTFAMKKYLQGYKTNSIMLKEKIREFIML